MPLRTVIEPQLSQLGGVELEAGELLVADIRAVAVDLDREAGSFERFQVDLGPGVITPQKFRVGFLFVQQYNGIRCMRMKDEMTRIVVQSELAEQIRRSDGQIELVTKATAWDWCVAHQLKKRLSSRNDVSGKDGPKFTFEEVIAKIEAL